MKDLNKELKRLVEKVRIAKENREQNRYCSGARRSLTCAHRNLDRFCEAHGISQAHAYSEGRIKQLPECNQYHVNYSATEWGTNEYTS